MKYLMLVLLLLSGCSVSIPTGHIEKAKELCAKNGGVKQVTGTNFFGASPLDINVDCNNGAHFYIGKLKK